MEGVHYIEMRRGPAAYVLGPPPSRGGDLELEGGVNACHVEYVITTFTSPYCLSVLVTLRFRLGRVTEKPLAHCTAR